MSETNPFPGKFFLCRIGRVGKAVKGIFGQPQRTRNIEFGQCQKNLRWLKDTSSNIVSTNPTVVWTRAVIDAAIIPSCRELERLFKKYGVNDVDALVKAINQPLLDSFKLTSIEQLRDTLAKITSKKFELSYLDKRISFDDFKYYVYNASKLGWTNVDCFAGDPSRKVTVKVNIKVQANISCKLLFKDSRSLIAAEKHNEMFEFPGVPKNKRGLLIAIKYEDGKPFLAMKEIVVTSSSIDLDWRLLTLDELKQELKRLDN